MSFPAGWYDDGSGRQRWWDGTRWTEHVAPPQPFNPPAQTFAPPAQTFAPPTQGFAPPTQGFAPPSSFAPPSPAAPAPWAANNAYGPPAASGYPLSAPPTAPGVSPLGWAALAASVVGALLALLPPLISFAVLVLVAGIVLSIVALVRPGAKWPGITGLIVSVLGLIIAGIVLFVSFVSATLTGISEGVADEWPDPVDSPRSAPVDGQTVDWWEVEVGDCLASDQPYYDEDGRVVLVPCDTPHGEEVYYEYDMTQREFPGDGDTEAEAEGACRAAFADFVGVPYEQSALNFAGYWPSQESWDSGDRMVQCTVYDDWSEVTGTLAGARR